MPNTILLASLFVTAATLTAMPVHAKDAGFRYKNGACTDSHGQIGYNPGFIGPCGDLRNTVIASFPFDGTDLSGSLFDNADLQSSTFIDAILTGVSFTGANLSGDNMIGAILHGTNFQNADLRNIKVSDVDASGANFGGADLTKVPLSYGNFKNCNFDGAQLIGSALDHADFSGSHFTETNFTDADMDSATLNGAILTKAVLIHANLDRANLTKSSAVGANFSSANLNAAVLSKADLTAATFRQAHMDGIKIDAANFSGTDLRGTLFKNVKGSGSAWTGAVFNKRSILPFDFQTAANLGMTFKTGGNVFVLWDIQDENYNSFLSALQVAGLEVTADSTEESTFTGSRDLSAYSAIVHLDGKVGNCNGEVDMPRAGQDALVNFVRAGGFFVQMEWSTCRYSFGHLQNMRDLLLFDRVSESGGMVEMNRQTAGRGEPILEGLPDVFEVGGHYNIGSVHNFGDQKTRILLKDHTGYDMLAIREFGAGQAMGFSLACNSVYPCLKDPNVQRIFINALNEH